MVMGFCFFFFFLGFFGGTEAASVKSGSGGADIATGGVREGREGERERGKDAKERRGVQGGVRPAEWSCVGWERAGKVLL